ncbi:hypothetical protein GALMADRAFT_227098 [Galerina marginata CBS 339.88]|uniref:CAP-Gly domain-containing protein n=1 Tax=Galerina marginata (strain CBS 339.88) TaxID=685588 RepID=A0A067T6D8_GALM3|nr:hypothetical protein GALMADRAFT_227098 [Galerina marginata CBS 339.88]
MTTPAKPRQSGVVGPGRPTSIPTPGRSRSSSNVHQNYQTPVEDISRAFADALKANDPSQHRILPLANSASTSSLSPQSVAYSSGRRSVVGRPSSVASSSSTKANERSRTPTSARIPSRPPSRQSESHKPVRTFDIDDNVRIESLGFEGTLRYVGEIDGKPGLWAGVELSGGFSGKGKNDGSVGGKQYFLCPDKCGVFVATTKLSVPTVGPGAFQRPSSVASSRGGKITPAPAIATSGRTTPSFFATSRTPSASFSNGRITPSSSVGRITHALSSGRITPSSNMAGSLQHRTFKTPTSRSTEQPLSDKITAGSRASKYMTMTAKQLISRDQDSGKDSPTRTNSGKFSSSMSSPTISRTLSSPTRPPGSPFTTPKPGYGRLSNAGGASPTMPPVRSRTSMNTPRARVPSAIAMPPPPSPKVIHIHQPAGTLEEALPVPLSDLRRQEMGAPSSVVSRPTSSTSLSSSGTDEMGVLEQLRSRLDAAEYENERLRAGVDTESGTSALVEQLKIERHAALDKASNLEEKLSALEDLLTSKTGQMETLQAENQKLLLQLTDATFQIQQAAAARQSDSETHAYELKLLQDRLGDLDRVNQEKDITVAAQSMNIARLEARVEASYIEFQEEKRELTVQIDELRVAGQETIALYEERLSVANSQRYEFEHHISNLEASLNSMNTNQSNPQQASQFKTSATQIDNETLHDQVQYLQKKSAKLEEQLEEARATLERDVTSCQDKIARLRHEDEQRRRDLAVKTRESEQLLKSEAGARNRVEEIEEALRESTVALENARGEVEALRAEFANLDILIDDASEEDISSKLANFTKRVSADRSQYQQEISQLERNLLDSRAENDILLKKIFTDSTDTYQASAGLQETVDVLNAENKTLRQQIYDLKARLLTLTQTLEDQTIEAEQGRKKLSREPVLNGTLESFKLLSLKSEPSTEEVAGLKHIVQELQKETLAAAQQIKFLESENVLLSAEAEQLRQEVHVLEENLDSSFSAEKPEVGTVASPRSLSDQSIQLETDLDQMRKRLNEAEIKHARTVHGLNKEISELETLVESKDELEQEVERLKEKLSRQKKISKNGHENAEGRQRLSSASSISTTSSGSISLGRGAEVCEICEQPGHDIFNCSLLKDDSGRAAKDVVCEDCESPGHVAADCPHSSDVF